MYSLSLLSLASLSLSPKHLTCSAVLLMDSTLMRSILVSAKGKLNVFISASCSSAPCLFLGTAVSEPRNTAERHHRFVHRRLHSRWCSLLHIAPDTFLHRLHQAPTALPALSIAAPKKKGGGSLNIDEFWLWISAESFLESFCGICESMFKLRTPACFTISSSAYES